MKNNNSAILSIILSYVATALLGYTAGRYFTANDVGKYKYDPYFDEKAYFVAFNPQTQTFSIIAPSGIVKSGLYVGSFTDSLSAVQTIPELVRRNRRAYGLDELESR